MKKFLIAILCGIATCIQLSACPTCLGKPGNALFVLEEDDMLDGENEAVIVDTESKSAEDFYESAQ